MPLGAARFGLLGGVADLGKLELIETQTVSTSTAYVDFTNLGNYNVHFMTINNGLHSSGVNYIRIRFIENGTLQSGSVYQYANQMNQAFSGAFERKSTSNTSIEHTLQLFSSGESFGSSYCYFYNLKDSSKYSFTTCHSIARYGDAEAGFGSGVMTQSSLVDGIRVYGGGFVNWTRVSISLYGIRYS
jgi:hypothetical protein